MARSPGTAQGDWSAMRRGDRAMAVIFLLLLLVAAAFYLRARFVAPPRRAVASVTINGEAVDTLCLEEGAEPFERVYRAAGGFNTMRAEGVSVSVVSADCPDKLCVKQGAIRRSGGVAVCLPHRFLLRVEGLPGDGLDGVVR